MKCAENCSSCVGPEVTQCTGLMPGFFYKDSSNTISPCKDPNCSICSNDEQCFSCKNQFYKQRLSEDPKVLAVSCKSCKIDNCKLCVIDDDVQEFTKCKYCLEGYGLNNG